MGFFGRRYSADNPFGVIAKYAVIGAVCFSIGCIKWCVDGKMKVLEKKASRIGEIIKKNEVRPRDFVRYESWHSPLYV